MGVLLPYLLLPPKLAKVHHEVTKCTKNHEGCAGACNLEQHTPNALAKLWYVEVDDEASLELHQLQVGQ